MGSTIAILAEEGDDLSGADALAKEPSAQQPPKGSTEKKPEPKEETPKSYEPLNEDFSSSEQRLETKIPDKGDRIFASPIAKKLALERGIPLTKVTGSGPNGRIIREDIEKYKVAADAGKGALTSISESMPAEYTDIPVSNMRRVIGSRLTQSKQEVPHYYLTVDIDMGRVLQLREVFNKALAGNDKDGKGTNKLSVNDFIMKGAACALAEVPEANSAWLGEVIRQSVLIQLLPPFLTVNF